MRILVVEDEPAIADFIERGLRSEGFDVESAADGVGGEERALEGGFDLMVLDLMLPGRPGLEVLRNVRRAKPRLPVIVLTARGQLPDRVAGLDAGANDYLAKPFAFAELAARVRAHLRAAEHGASTALRVGDIDVDLIKREVRRCGDLVRLSSTEFELLTYFMRHPDQVVSREQILSSVWGYEHDPGTNVVDVYVGYLRRKLGRPERPLPLLTVRAVGYRLSSNG